MSKRCISMQDEHVVKCDECDIKKPSREMWKSDTLHKTLCDKHFELFIQIIDKNIKKKLIKIINPFKWLNLKLFGDSTYKHITQEFYKGDSNLFIEKDEPSLTELMNYLHAST